VLIAVEGGEGSGKSTQQGMLADWLRELGCTVVVSYEPGATSVGKHIRRLVLETDEQIAPRSEALLFAADRAQHVATVIRPALDRGEVVITDRFVDSSIAYQGTGRTLSSTDVRQLSDWATEGLVPDLTLLLDIEPAAGLARAHRREGDIGLDRLEREELAFHERVRQGFLDLAAAEPGRYLVLDASLPATELAEQIRPAVQTLLAADTKRTPR
jgi:dTMP kinase